MVSIMPDVSYLRDILHSIIYDLIQSNGKKNTDRDILYVDRRLSNEGMAFLTKTLPTLGRALDSALKTGTYLCPTNFRKKRGTALPNFTWGLLKRIFDPSGILLSDPDVYAIAELRQLYFMFYKVVVDFTPADVAKAEQKFIQTDQYLAVRSLDDLSPDGKRVLSLAREYIEQLFYGFDPLDITPNHGPGIVASGEEPHEKRLFSTKYNDIHAVYPYYRYFYVNSAHLLHTVPDYWNREVKSAGANKVLFVPKDSRGPRTIACEPLEYQFLQQGLRKLLYNWVESHPLTKGRINFTDQKINGRLAFLSSTVRSDLCTIDLRDASDRVSNDLVKRLFFNTSLSKPLQALRTPVSVLPSGEECVLNKYAAMGSALCFPIEAICFDALLHGVYSFFPHLNKEVYVYGDDIIAHCEVFDTIVRIFDEFGLCVNADKSFTTGRFRESCGHEYYNGQDVTYVKVRSCWIGSPNDVVSTVELSNLLFDRGYYKASDVVARYAQQASLTPLPYGYKDSPYLCFYSTRNNQPSPVGRTRYNKVLQRTEHRVPVVTGSKYSATPNTDTETYAEYYRKLTQGWSEFFRRDSYNRKVVRISRKYVQLGV